jgi:hypothetical protein
MNFKGTIYAVKHREGVDSYLIAPKDTQAFMRYVSWSMSVANRFVNVTVKPYKGRKYNPAFVWVCVG